MNKQQIYDAMGERISMSAISEFSGEYQILGKFGMVCWMGDFWDVWITGVHRGKELSQRKVNSLCRQIRDCTRSDSQELTGEAYAIVDTNEQAFLVACILGARKKRQYSPESLEKLRARGFGKQAGDEDKEYVS